MNSHEVFIHIHRDCFAGTRAIVRLPQCRWSRPDAHERVSQCITTTKHSGTGAVCVFLGIYCTCLCRCGVSVVACDTVGCLCDNPRGAGGYQIVTMTTLFPVFNKSSTSLKRNCCRFGGVFVAGCTGNCHAGNFHCGRLRKLRRNGVFISFFVLGDNLWAFWWARILIP